MASDPGELYQSPESSASEGGPPRKEHGCFFYGCIIAIVLAVLMAVGVGLAGFFGYRALVKAIEQNTSPTPVNLPKVKMAPEDQKALDGRVEAFKTALDKGEEAEPLVLTGDELNALMAEKGKTEGRVYFIIDGDKLKGEVSLPLDELKLPIVPKGRYFNGSATFRVALEDGRLVVFADAAEVNGKPLSEQFMGGLRSKNLAEDATRQPENAAFLEKLESIQIKDGKVIIKAKAKAKAKPSSAEGAPEPAKEAGKEGEPAGDNPAPKEKSRETPSEPAKEPAEAKPEPK